MGQEKMFKTSETKSSSGLLEKGQVAVEFVLMVVVAVTIATMIVSALVSRSTDEPGLVIQAWQRIVNAISNDNAAEP